jgi:hypothetical protein
MKPEVESPLEAEKTRVGESNKGWVGYIERMTQRTGKHNILNFMWASMFAPRISFLHGGPWQGAKRLLS